MIIMEKWIITKMKKNGEYNTSRKKFYLLLDGTPEILHEFDAKNFGEACRYCDKWAKML